MDPGMNSLLKWSIENSAVSKADPTSESEPPRESERSLNEEALRTLMGGPSEADLMKDAMSAIVTPTVDLDNKLIAFDNFEQLIETIDNANNMANLGLWTPLISQLDAEEAQLRTFAAWCVGTAVQNNEKAQETALATGAVKKLLTMVVDESDTTTRRKAVYALSSAVRNYQPSTDLMVEKLDEDVLGAGKKGLDATDMDGIDTVMEKLRAMAKEAS
ncbi:MAG: hypothetical protein M4579_007058 [Chaenotheca gracillima]|nr:MAG: hypothetical protein M4579_007058 [Chaenotheca gracillima]